MKMAKTSEFVKCHKTIFVVGIRVINVPIRRKVKSQSLCSASTLGNKKKESRLNSRQAENIMKIKIGNKK